jgi:hypothetical protein
MHFFEAARTKEVQIFHSFLPFLVTFVLLITERSVLPRG